MLDGRDRRLYRALFVSLRYVAFKLVNGLGYPTQKPLALLDRIIRASSDPGQVILDPFCGCGTTVEAAEKAGRNWIGIDIAIHAVKVIEGRLTELGEARGKKVDYELELLPRDFPDDADDARKGAHRS